MPLDRRTFKRMDNDSAIEKVGPEDYSYALNVSVYNDGFLHKILGNTLIPYTLPAGTNTVIGSKENFTNNCVYFFVYNSLGSHLILRYNRDLGTITTILEEQVIPVLLFQLEYKITSIDFVYLDGDDLLIYWTDGVNPPRKINERRALGFQNRKLFYDNFYSSPSGKVGFVFTQPHGFVVGDKIKIVQDAGYNNSSYNNYTTVISATATSLVTDIPFGVSTPPQGGYIVYSYAYSIIDEQAIDAVKWAAQYQSIYGSAPLATGQQNLTYPRNNIQNNFFQFAMRNVYDDFEKGAISPYSEVVLNENNTINAIQLVFNSGAPNIRKIELIARTKTSVDGQEIYNDPFIFKTIDKEEGQIQDNSYVTDLFYNDALVTPISPIDKDKLFDWLPRYAFCQSTISGNEITYANYTEQFDLVKPDVTMDIITNSISSVSLNDDIYLLQQRFVGPFYTKNPSDIINGGGTPAFGLNTVSVYIPSITLPGTFSNPSTIKITFSDGTIYLRTMSGNNFSNYPKSILYIIAVDLLTLGYETYYSPNDPFTLLINAKDLVAPQTTGGSVLASAAVLSNSGTDTVICAPKNGATHNYGIVYYDRANRSSTVIKDASMSKYIPFTVQNLKGTYSYFKMNINHLPPEWATHYQIVYTKNTTIKSFFQIPISKVEINANDVDLILNNLSGLNISYSFTPGDRVRLIAKSPNIYLLPVVDLPVVGYNQSTKELTVPLNNIFSTNSVVAGSLIEVYTPKLGTDENIYYEISKENTILNPHTDSRAHNSAEQTQIVSSGISTQPAIITIQHADTYFRNIEAGGFSYIVEDANYTYKYPSAVTDTGRPNIVDDNFREVKRESSITWSGKFIPETSVNGLSSFPGGNFKYYSISNGAIKRIINKEQFLKVFQEFKIGSVPIEQNIQQTLAGAVVVNNNFVLNEIRYHVGNYGLTHPESLATFGFADYGIDVNRGVIWRDSNDGLTPISMVYRLNQKTTETCKFIRANGLSVNIYGVFNKIRMQYELCFSTLSETVIIPGSTRPFVAPRFVTTTLFDGFTVAFNERDNTWCGFYSYNNEGMCSSNMDIVSFKNGKCYLHNSNPLAGNFYGTQYPGQVWVPSNDSPSVVKIWNAISEEAENIWEIESITNNNSQNTNLTSANFEQIEGIYYSALNKDTTTPNVTDPLWNGAEIRDVATLFKMSYDGTEETKLKAINFNYEPSFRSGF